MPPYELNPDASVERGRINCHGCGQDRERVLLEAPDMKGAVEAFRRGEGLCAACHADEKADLAWVTQADVDLYSGKAHDAR